MPRLPRLGAIACMLGVLLAAPHVQRSALAVHVSEDLEEAEDSEQTMETYNAKEVCGLSLDFAAKDVIAPLITASRGQDFADDKKRFYFEPAQRVYLCSKKRLARHLDAMEFGVLFDGETFRKLTKEETKNLLSTLWTYMKSKHGYLYVVDEDNNVVIAPIIQNVPSDIPDENSDRFKQEDITYEVKHRDLTPADFPFGAGTENINNEAPRDLQENILSGKYGGRARLGGEIKPLDVQEGETPKKWVLNNKSGYSLDRVSINMFKRHIKEMGLNPIFEPKDFPKEQMGQRSHQSGMKELQNFACYLTKQLGVAMEVRKFGAIAGCGLEFADKSGFQVMLDSWAKEDREDQNAAVRSICPRSNSEWQALVESMNEARDHDFNDPPQLHEFNTQSSAWTTWVKHARSKVPLWVDDLHKKARKHRCGWTQQLLKFATTKCEADISVKCFNQTLITRASSSKTDCDEQGRLWKELYKFWLENQCWFLGNV